MAKRWVLSKILPADVDHPGNWSALSDYVDFPRAFGEITVDGGGNPSPAYTLYLIDATNLTGVFKVNDFERQTPVALADDPNLFIFDELPLGAAMNTWSEAHKLAVTAALTEYGITRTSLFSDPFSRLLNEIGSTINPAFNAEAFDVLPQGAQPV